MKFRFRIMGIGVASFTLAVGLTGLAHADLADPEYASNSCLRDKRPSKVCCEEVLDGDKKEIAECVQLVASKRKKGADAKAARASKKADALAVEPTKPARNESSGNSEALEGTSKAVAPGDITWSFEEGDLRGWDATGTAFKFQPTYGDNPTARRRGQPSKHQGNYWIGTYEKRPTPADPPGAIQDDNPKGTLTSKPFPVKSRKISFLIGGGCDIKTVRVELLIDGNVVDKVTGKCNESMARAAFNVGAYANRMAQIRLVDESSNGWGHINFDDVRFE